MGKREFKIGDKVKLNPTIAKFRYGKAGVENDEIGEIILINMDMVKIKFPSHDCWLGKVDEIVFAESTSQIEVGDTVRINKNATIEDFTKNNWNGCCSHTIRFLNQHADKDEEFKVLEITKMGNVRLKGICYDLVPTFLNINIFELVKKKEIKEVTMEELNKLLGCEVKIVEKKGSEE